MKKLLFFVSLVISSLFVGVHHVYGITINCSGQVNTSTGTPVDSATVSIIGGMGAYRQPCGTPVDVTTNSHGAWTYAGNWPGQCYVDKIEVRKPNYLPNPKIWPRILPFGSYDCTPPNPLIIDPVATPTDTPTPTPTPGGPTPTDTPTPTPGGPTPTDSLTPTPSSTPTKYICADPSALSVDDRCKVDPAGTYDTQYECYFSNSCGGPINPGCGGHFDTCCTAAPICLYANEACVGGYCVPVPPAIPTDLPCVSQSKIPTAIGCIAVKDPNDFMANLLKLSLGIGGGLAFLMMLVGSLRIMLSGGDRENLQAGKELITSAIAGLLMIVFSVYLLELIGTKILGLPGL